MKITLILIGKTTDKNLDVLIKEYQNRLTHYLPFEIKIIPELRNTKSLTPEQQKEKEAELALQQLSPSDFLVLLDERGKEFRSIEFSQHLSNLFNSSPKRIVFLIGGPYGFAPSVYERSQQMLSLSKMTFSHQLIRVLFVEQLYRAFTIMKGEPYHHE